MIIGLACGRLARVLAVSHQVKGHIGSGGAERHAHARWRPVRGKSMKKSTATDDGREATSAEPGSRPRSPHPTRGTAAALVSLLALSLAAACSDAVADDAPSTAATGAPDASDGAPEFSGPWADDIAHTYEELGTDFSRTALADSAISDVEYQEGMALIQECYDAAGFTVEYDKYGFETVTSVGGEEDPMDVMNRCAFADGGVAVLYQQMKANPENVEQETLVAECLVREGVVEPGFTGQDFTEVMDSGEVPWSPVDERIEPCFKDPLGLLAGSGE